MSWFESLFGVRERDWHSTRTDFAMDGTTLVSPNGRRFETGDFSTPSLGELRDRAREVGKRGTVSVRHCAIGDVLEMHALSSNRGAMFQVASQLNCLEFAAPDVVPEVGITGYANDRTQGPACSLAAAPATLYRNYFAPVGEQLGQTRDCQIDTLHDLTAALGEPDAYYTVRNGYTDSDPARLAALCDLFEHRDRDALLRTVRIGVQTGTEVVFAHRFEQVEQPTFVSQAFCSAISFGYAHGTTAAEWEPLARLVLDAAYEATLLAAVIDAAEGEGSGVVWLTLVGGGVFANPMPWIAGAIARAVQQVAQFELDVRVGHYRRVDEHVCAVVG